MKKLADVVIYVEGGVVQMVWAKKSSKNIVLIDADNRKEESKTAYNSWKYAKGLAIGNKLEAKL